MNCEEFVENIENFKACHPTAYDIVNNEPKPGEYIRTTDGYIRRLKFVNTDANIITRRGKYILDVPHKNCGSIARKKIKKHSFNIIDLIEIGDYINGHRVTDVYFSKYNGYMAEIEDDGTQITEDEIKSIVTKEAFKNAEYRMETDLKLWRIIWSI